MVDQGRPELVHVNRIYALRNLSRQRRKRAGGVARARRVKLGGAKHNTGLVSIAASQETIDELVLAARLDIRDSILARRSFLAE